MPSHIAFRALGWDVDLDHKTPHREARAPQSVMQEQLNRDDSQLWRILCNGVTLRLLRDSTTLVGSSYVEFDVKAIFDGELFSDFVLLYLTCHESRFALQGDGGPESCYLEQWPSPRQRRTAPGRPQPRAAPPGVPNPLLVRRGRPRCAADPRRFRGNVSRNCARRFRGDRRPRLVTAHHVTGLPARHRVREKCGLRLPAQIWRGGRCRQNTPSVP
jgi:hypothetical protein